MTRNPSSSAFPSFTRLPWTCVDFLETQLNVIGRLGLELYAQHHIGGLGED